jgi:hypothetical protein
MKERLSNLRGRFKIVRTDDDENEQQSDRVNDENESNDTSDGNEDTQSEEEHSWQDRLRARVFKKKDQTTKPYHDLPGAPDPEQTHRKSFVHYVRDLFRRKKRRNII